MALNESNIIEYYPFDGDLGNAIVSGGVMQQIDWPAVIGVLIGGLMILGLALYYKLRDK